jgi:drug/metabolite transporter (DMT)-like permease
VVFFNACPLLVLCPLILINRKQLCAVPGPTIFAAVMIGLAFSLYANGLVETTVVRATLLYYLTPVWSTLIGVLRLS